MSDDSKIEQKALACPICQSNKAMIAGENVKLGGKFEDKEFQQRIYQLLLFFKQQEAIKLLFS